MKPVASLRAPQAILNAKWCHDLSSASVAGEDSWQRVPLATSFDQEDPRILFWDLATSFATPSRVFNQYDVPPSSFVWQSDAFLWSVGSHGIFNQVDVTSLPRRKPTKTKGIVAIKPDGTLLHVYNEPKGRSRFASHRDMAPRSTTSEEGESSDRLDFSQPIHLSPTSRAQEFRVQGLFKDVSTLNTVITKCRHLPELPNNALSTKQDLVFGDTLMYNRDVAKAAGLSDQSSQWIHLMSAGQKELKRRAEGNRTHRKGTNHSRSFVPSDFVPKEHEGYNQELTEIQVLCRHFCNTNDFGLINLSYLVYIFLNILPWFPLPRHAFSDNHHRDVLICFYHAQLMRHQLYTAACQLRQSWARLCGNVEEKLSISTANKARAFCKSCCKPSKVDNGIFCERCGNILFECSFCCIVGKREEMWLWCQKCGHGGHLKCLQTWFLEPKNTKSCCCTIGCTCNCLPDEDADG